MEKLPPAINLGSGRMVRCVLAERASLVRA
jgi:hypothetical protein